MKENEKLIKVVVYTQQGKTFFFKNVIEKSIEKSIKKVNFELFFDYYGEITGSINSFVGTNPLGYSILADDAKILDTSK